MASSLLLSLLLVAPAAQPPAPRDDVESRAHVERGQAHYRRGEYEAAAAQFLNAYQATRLPALLYNVAQAQRLAGRCAEAAAHYRRFLAEVPVSPHRRLARAHLAETAICAAAPAAPAPAPSTPAPAISAALAVPAAAAPSAVAAAPEPAVAWTSRSAWGAGLVGGGALFAGLGGVMTYRAHTAASRTSALFEHGGDWDSRARENERTGIRSARFALVAYAAATVCVATGAWLWLAGDGAVAVAAGPESAAVALRGRF